VGQDLSEQPFKSFKSFKPFKPFKMFGAADRQIRDKL
jgi:hypothetical protein